MALDGKLRLNLVDVYGNRLGEKVDIDLRHRTLDDHRVVRGVSAGTRLLIPDLHGAPEGMYKVEIDPPAYLPVSQFVSLEASDPTDVEVTFPIDPKKVVSVNFPAFAELAAGVRSLLESSNEVLGFDGLSGEGLYGDLDPIRRAGFLNIVTKAQASPLSSGQTVFPFIQRLTELRGDRFFAVVPKELREETKNSVADGLFQPASELLHRPPDGFSPAGSFKTEDNFGNLQLSFFMRGDDCVADIDIDDANGLGHVFQVLRNTLTGRPTHPYDIHEILVFHQKLRPPYTFVV